MLKRILAGFILFCMLIGLLPTAVLAADPVVAKIGNTTYPTLAAAVAAVEDGGEIEVLANPDEDDVAYVNKLISFMLTYARANVGDLLLHIQPAPESGILLKRTGMSYQTHNAESWVFHDYTLTYDPNGSTSKPREDGARSDRPYRLSSRYLFTAPEGKSFKAWLIDGVEYPALSSVTITKDTVAYAVWQDIEDIVITEDRLDIQKEIVAEELTAVPQSLTESYASVEAIKTELKASVTTQMPGVSRNHVEIADVTLRFKPNNSNTWVDATEKNFPAEGITVTLPYPTGTAESRDELDFIVSHMITTGERAGTIETPDVTKTDAGLVVTLTGLSPIAIGWKAAGATEAAKTPDLWFAVLLRLYQRQYSIVAGAGEGGTISDAGLTMVKYKRNQTYTIAPAEGYEIVDVLVDGVSVGAVTTYTFKHVKEDHRIEAVFAPKN